MPFHPRNRQKMIFLPGYQVASPIHKGEKSIIYRGLREYDCKPVVIKWFYKPYPSLEELDRFRREYDITRMFDSQGIIKTYGFERYNHSSAIILEDFPGKSLRECLNETPFHPAQFLPLSIRIAEALEEIHGKRVIHRDIHPGNILWDKDSGQVRIIDFSVSTYVYSNPPETITPDALQGTLAYMSPEQTGRMNRPVDYHTDFYSLGVTFYHMLTGRLPFESDDPMTLVHSLMAIHPESPSRINPRIPRTLSDIIMKLMAKNAEDRYQRLSGLVWDLQTCLDKLNALGRIPVFDIGRKDIQRKFYIPQKLYGRDDENLIILSAFGRAAIGKKEKILIAGPSGIGKSALVSQVKKELNAKPGFFIYGKFDQFQRNIPYSALDQAAKGLFQQIVTGGEASISFWKEELSKTMGSNARVMTHLIPELELIIGKQPEIQEISGAEAQSRFHLAVLSFLSAFDKQKHALAICMDDLQWADEASLQLIELILNEPDLGHLLFIGTYRDNEVDASHPVTGFFNRIDQSETPTIRIFLKPLGKNEINQFLSEILLCRPEHLDEVATLCHEKTHGNPFFFIQMVQSLHENRHIFFDPYSGCWKWDADAIRLASITENVLELMVNAIHRLTGPSQNALRVAACIGARFDLKTLSLVIGQPVMETAQQLWPMLEHGLVIHETEELHNLKRFDRQTDARGGDIAFQGTNPAYEFVHDRIRQAAYEMLAEDERIRIELKIGYLLWDSFLIDESSETVFDIVTHLNAGSPGITDPEKRFVLAQLNLTAGKRAKVAAAFEPSLKYLKTGISLLPENSWTQAYPLTFDFYFEAVEAAFLSGDFAEMEILADAALNHASSVLDKAKIYSVKIQYYYAQNELMKVVEEGVTILGLMGYRFPANPTKLHILLKLVRARFALMAKISFKVNSLGDIEDPVVLTAMRIMVHLGHAAFGARPNLPPLLSFQAMLLSLKHGVAPETPVSFIFYGVVLCGAFNQIDAGYGFGELALKLNDRPCVQHFRARVIFAMGGMIVHWKHHLKDTLRPYLLNAYDIGMAAGDYEFGTLSAFFYCAYSYFMGTPLSDLSDEMALYSTTIRRSRQTTHFYFNEMVRQVVLNLMGASDDPCRLAGDAYDEDQRLPEHQKANDTSAIHMLFLYKMQLCYLFGRYQEALECSRMVETCLEGMLATAYVPLFHFYDSLIRITLLSDGKHPEKKRFLKKIAANQKKLKKWAFHCPMNYEHKFVLVEAERMRLSGQTVKAAKCYNKAISLAEKQGYIQEEALGNELAAGFWRETGNSDIAGAYLKKAVYCYDVWGAKAKVDFMSQTHPLLLGLTQERQASLFKKKQVRPIVSTVPITSDEETAERDKGAAQAAEDRGKNEFLANLSHDIRSPLNAVIGFTELIAETSLSPEQSFYIEKIRESSTTLLSRINGLFDGANIEPGNQDLEDAPASEIRPLPGLSTEFPESIRGIHVLVVEDSEINRLIIRKMLEDAQIQVTLVHNGWQAISALDESVYDAVLMDIQMPGMDGYETARRIRHNPRHEHLPIIALTAYVLDGSREKCLDAGMNDVVTKPIDYSQLFATLARYVAAAGSLGIGEGIPEKKQMETAPPNLSGGDLFGGFAGMDVAAGLKRLGGKRELYVRVLKEFHKEYHNAPELLANALKKGDRELIHRVAHTIKGLAANIGAADLKTIAGKIETACASDGSMPCLSDLDAFNYHLKAFFADSKKVEACLMDAHSCND
ncbi:MAG: response regulator [Desulfobacteraceae bacterium]|nr:MAG: response regulator [Desulfobacteraceae bacterium]